LKSHAAGLGAQTPGTVLGGADINPTAVMNLVTETAFEFRKQSIGSTPFHFMEPAPNGISVNIDRNESLGLLCRPNPLTLEYRNQPIYADERDSGTRTDPTSLPRS
jgi:hypothetical protein